MEQNKRRQIAKISVFITSVFVIFLSITYAFINMTVTGTKRQVITSGNLQVELEEDNAITLTNAMPMYDEVGMIQDAFNFRLVNKTSEDTNYIVKLVDITDASKNKLDTSIVKYGLTKDGVATTSLLSTLKDNKVDSGTINGNQTIHYSLRLWINSTVTDNNTIKDKMLSYRIDVEIGQEAFQEKSLSVIQTRKVEEQYIGGGTTMLVPSEEGFYTYRNQITEIVFENRINIPTTIDADHQWDISEAQDESVIAYVEENGILESDETSYRLHIQGDGGVAANPQSGALFYGFANLVTINGFEYFDVSSVESFAYRAEIDQGSVLSIFGSCNNLKLDLENLDTSKVENMGYMFYMYTGSILNLSKLNTSNVTYMSNMFSDCRNLTNLDLSYFDTSNVTNMNFMFLGCSSLTNLNISNFNTTNVTNMSGMFGDVKNDCLITVKDEATKNWVLERNSSLTNVVVKSA